MSKRTVFSTVTPLPPGLSRAAVLETLHSHYEMIDLNPLVIDRFKCEAPAHASEEERNCKWYTIKDKIDYLPGGLASGDVSYSASFHDLPDGLQTHTFAPMGVDIRGRWTLGGTLPGEPKQVNELGSGVPKEGLWLKEDVDLRCNVLMAGFVKKNMQKSHGVLVEKLFEKIRSREEDRRRGNGSPANSVPSQSSPAPGSQHSNHSQQSLPSTSPGGHPAAGYYVPEGQKVNHFQRPRLYGHDLPGQDSQTSTPPSYRNPSSQPQAGPLPTKGYAQPSTSAYQQQALSHPAYHEQPSQTIVQELPSNEPVASYNQANSYYNPSTPPSQGSAFQQPGSYVETHNNESQIQGSQSYNGNNMQGYQPTYGSASNAESAYPAPLNVRRSQF